MSEFTTMSEIGDALPTTIDTTAEIDWPDDMPDVPELQGEVSEDEQENEPETVDWTQILHEQDQRRIAVTIETRQQYCGTFYSHLPNSDIDWEIEGRFICRVKHIVCYGKNYINGTRLMDHLKSARHKKFDAALSRQIQALPSNKRQPEPPTARATPVKKPRLPHTIDNPTGHDLCLPWVLNKEALEELPRALKYPPWMEIPDSQETENGLMFEMADTDEVLPQYPYRMEIPDSQETENGLAFEMSDEALPQYSCWTKTPGSQDELDSEMSDEEFADSSSEAESTIVVLGG
ncbi:hypothetical protein H9Q74_013044 [Fusarium xylarioides]|nr:hypothetical protein H9Q71_013122 [Fusarium xylarioides]KAG5812616.1 hypothetical protein H9Q74_013044 [Fusarium xylarioides]